MHGFQYCGTKRRCDFERYKRIRNQTNEEVKKNPERKVAGKAKTRNKHFWKCMRS